MSRADWTVLAVVGVVLVAVLFPHAIPWLLGVYPTPPGTPWTYQLWSGFMPALAIVGVVWPFVNCHVQGCMRYGRYHVREFRVCHRHHPDDRVGPGGIRAEHVAPLTDLRERE